MYGVRGGLTWPYWALLARQFQSRAKNTLTAKYVKEIREQMGEGAVTALLRPVLGSPRSPVQLSCASAGLALASTSCSTGATTINNKSA